MKKNRRVKCPCCGVFLINIPDNWTDEHALQVHFNNEYDKVYDLKYGNKPCRQINPCHRREVVIRKEKIDEYTKQLLDALGEKKGISI
jgi:hypothetical protein